LNQVPPGAQQLTRPDALNMPQSEHIAIAGTTAGVVIDIIIGMLDIFNRASHR